MRASKQPTGTKVKKTKGKRVSLRCPLSTERTDLEYNYDTSALQVCMTVENMGGGGLASDTVESAVIVVRLFDADGKLHPCRGNEYFAKLLRFGENGLESGARITFRLLPDCDGGTRVEDVEIYISRIRYTDGTVTDYVRGDFFDLPGEGVPLVKKFKKNPDTAIEALGEGALYVPEKLTEIVWRCTCGEFSESDTCPTCNRNKNELFAALDALTAPKVKKTPAPPVSPSPAPAADSADGGASALPADGDETAEYSTAAAKAALAAMNAENEESAGNAGKQSQDEADQDAPIVPLRTSQKGSPDKTRNILLIAIAGASVVLLVILLLLILTLCGKGGSSDATGDTTTPGITDSADSNNAAETVIRTYLSQNDFDNALGYAIAADCDPVLIEEIQFTAMQYYLNANELDKALEWAQKTGNQTYIDTVNNQRFYAALNAKDYLAALDLVSSLSADRQESARKEAAEAYIAALIEQGKHSEAMTVADAVSLAEQLNMPALVISAATSAVDYYVARNDYDSAADYVGLTENTAKMQTVLGKLTDAQIRRHLPTFFSLLTFDQMQKAHAAPMGSKPSAVAAIDNSGNVYLGKSLIYDATRYTAVVDPETGDPVIDAETGEPVYEASTVRAVSVSCCDTTVVILLEDGTVRIAEGTNRYYSQADIDNWSNIVAICASNYHLLGLKSDGTVVAAGSNVYGQCNTAELKNAVAISAGDNHSMILHADGTVTALGYNVAGICDTEGWTDIIAISAGSLHSIGLKADGTVVAKGNCNVTGWSNVVAVFSTATNAVALKSDGTLLCSVNNAASNLLADVTDAIWVSVGKQAVTILHRTDDAPGVILLSGSTLPTLPDQCTSDIFGIE